MVRPPIIPAKKHITDEARIAASDAAEKELLKNPVEEVVPPTVPPTVPEQPAKQTKKDSAKSSAKKKPWEGLPSGTSQYPFAFTNEQKAKAEWLMDHAPGIRSKQALLSRALDAFMDALITEHWKA